MKRGFRLQEVFMSKNNNKTGNVNSQDTQADQKPKAAEPENNDKNPNAGQAAAEPAAETPVPGPDDASASESAQEALKADVPLTPEQKIAELEGKLADLNDQYLRKAADFENYRKRTLREKQELTEFANQSLLLDLLPVIDDFERAIKSSAAYNADNFKDFSGFYEGIKMIEKGLSSQLESKWGLKRFDSEGTPFDPNRHEALQMEKSAEISEAVVKEDYVKGYMLKDRVIRYAKVKVIIPEEGSKE